MRDKIEETKLCSKCNQTKSIKAFGERSRSPDGRQGYCRECFSKYRAKYRREHPEFAEKQRRMSIEYNKTDKYRIGSRLRAKAYRLKFPEKVKAAKLANSKISIKAKCYFCKTDKFLLRHHFDYSKPLEVFIVCKSCHLKLHHLLKIHVYTR